MFPDPELKVQQLGTSDTSQQRGFRFNNCNGEEVGVVIDKFRDGFCCWGVLPTGFAVRF